MAGDQHERWEATQFGASWAVHPVGAAGDERWDIARVSPEAYHPDGWEAAKAEAERRARLIAAAPEMADRIEALEAEVERLTAQRDWHQARNDALQKVQRHMRDPERKAVCDILANGTTYVEPFRAALAGEEET